MRSQPTGIRIGEDKFELVWNEDSVLCPTCNHPVVSDWLDVTAMEDPSPRQIRGRSWCSNNTNHDVKPVLHEFNWPKELKPEDREWLRRQTRLSPE